MSESRKDRKKRVRFRDVRGEAWALVSAQRKPLLIGLGLMVIGRLASLVLPASSKFLIDNVLGEGREELLLPLAAAAAVATVVQAATSFGLAQIVSIAAQRAIRDMRASRPGARHPSARLLLRLDEERRADLADHERSRGHPQPGRHGLIQLVGGASPRSSRSACCSGSTGS
jgi:hypothetical protein